MIGIPTQAAPRSQAGHRLPSVDPSRAEAPVEPARGGYLPFLGPAPMNLIDPIARVRTPRPTFPAAEERARDPEAYAAGETARREGDGSPGMLAERAGQTTLSVGGDILPEVSVSPYSESRLRPEEVLLFFKDEKLDGLRGGVIYPAARLRFEPAQPDVRASSSAIYTRQ